MKKLQIILFIHAHHSLNNSINVLWKNFLAKLLFIRELLIIVPNCALNVPLPLAGRIMSTPLLVYLELILSNGILILASKGFPFSLNLYKRNRKYYTIEVSVTLYKL
jgi:hypothetical protein